MISVWSIKTYYLTMIIGRESMLILKLDVKFSISEIELNSHGSIKMDPVNVTHKNYF